MVYMGDEFGTLNELVRFCHTLDRPDKRLQICLNVCQMIESMEKNPDMEKEIKDMQKFARGLLTNSKFRRKIHKRHALMEREPITYFGDEIAKGDHYDYDEVLEEDITVIDFKIVTFLGNVLAFIQGEQTI